MESLAIGYSSLVNEMCMFGVELRLTNKWGQKTQNSSILSQKPEQQ